jgi:Domain of unknown function (DUF6249)
MTGWKRTRLQFILFSRFLKKNATSISGGLSYSMQRTFRVEEVAMEAILLDTLVFLVPIAFFSFLAVAIWAKNRRREREAYYKNETIKKIAEAQEPAANAALELLREQEKVHATRRREGIKLGGLVTIAVGLGFIPLLRAVHPHEPVYLVGLIPLLIGLALLAYAYVLAPKE